MIAKLTSKNKLTLPMAVVCKFPGVRYFEVSAEAGRIVLVPARVSSLDATWSKLEALDIREKNVKNAVQWARRARKRSRGLSSTAMPSSRRRSSGISR